MKESIGLGYNPYIFLNVESQAKSVGLGIFLGTARDTLSVFNGVGTEYYVKFVTPK